jgi:hypothetical protein
VCVLPNTYSTAIINEPRSQEPRSGSARYSREAVAIDLELRSSNRDTVDVASLELYTTINYTVSNTMKYYTLLSLYYASTLVRGLLLVALVPLNFVFEALYSIVSEWEPNKPLHKSDEHDPYADPDNLGV